MVKYIKKPTKNHIINIIFGPPSNSNNCNEMMSLFFSQTGKHIICGGTTSLIAAKYLGKEIKTSLNFESPEIPPIAKIDGVDLVTEGVITINKVLEYAKDFLSENKQYKHWQRNQDGASLISKLLFEEATDINFYIGQAINPSHQTAKSQINLNIKINIVKELSLCLTKMGKQIKISYF